MSAQMNGATPLYTVEQLELIRRLRNSGISKDDIINAFDSFDRLDRELGPVYNIPVTLALQAQALQLMALGIANPPALQVNNNVLASGHGHTIPRMAHPAIKTQPASMTQLVAPPGPTLPPMTPVLKHSASTPSLESESAANLAQMANSILKNGFQDSEVDSKEFAEFISKGDAACCEEIKAFAAKHNIKQQQIATLAGICQSYVSRYMKGDIYDMSERSRRAIQKWYLVYRKNPAAIAMAANAAMLLINATPGGQQAPKKFITPNSLDLTELASTAAAAGSTDVNFPRRERFVFRPNHLEILERYFQDNNYPSYETREEIAKACNAVTETVAGRELTEREKVTAQIISNWFANKRKELKKLAREEGLMDVSMVPMRPRGHPSRLYSELALMQQYRGELNNAVTSSVMQSPESSSRDGDAGEEGNSENRTASSNHINLEKGDGGESQQSDDGMDEEESLHWSVEMAAVNQAILSLTGQQPIEVTPSAERGDREEGGSHQALNTPPPPTSSDI